MSALNIIGGAILLTLGRRIFWLFVAVSGFYAGFELESRYLNIHPQWLALAIAILFGIVCAVLAYFFQHIVIGVAGFLAGALIMSRLMPHLGSAVKGWEWLIILIGGLIGVLLMFVIFDWALVILSSLAGALMIVDGLKLTGPVELAVTVILFIVGIVFQTTLHRRFGSRHRRALI